jgi:hypothetical protein
VSEIGLPDDVNVLLDDSDGALIGSVEVRPQPAAYAPAGAVAPTYAQPQAETLEVPTFAGTADTSSQDTTAMPLVDPPASGFVSGVTLGEVEAPEMPDGPVDLVEPSEFELPGFDVLGERERDMDIEEID